MVDMNYSHIWNEETLLKLLKRKSCWLPKQQQTWNKLQLTSKLTQRVETGIWTKCWQHSAYRYTHLWRVQQHCHSVLHVAFAVLNHLHTAICCYATKASKLFQAYSFRAYIHIPFYIHIFIYTHQKKFCTTYLNIFVSLFHPVRSRSRLESTR